MVKRWLKQVGVLVLIGSAMSAATVWAQGEAQNECGDKRITDADQLYKLGFFDKTIAKLRPCMAPKGFPSKALRQPAYRLMALSYFEKDEPDSSRSWIEALMKDENGYQADPSMDPLFFQYWVDELRPKWYQRRWVKTLGLGMVAGGVSFFLLLRPSTDKPLPGPSIMLPGQ